MLVDTTSICPITRTKGTLQEVFDFCSTRALPIAFHKIAFQQAILDRASIDSSRISKSGTDIMVACRIICSTKTKTELDLHTLAHHTDAAECLLLNISFIFQILGDC